MNLHSRTTLSVTAFFLVTLVGCGGSATTPSASGNKDGSDESGWVEHKSKEGKYTVLFPTEPIHEAQKPAGGDIVTYLATATDSKISGSYEVRYWDLDPEETKIDAEANLLRRVLDQQAFAKILKKEPTKVNGYPAIRVEMERLKGDPTSEHQLMVIANGRLYIVHVVGEPGKIEVEDVKKFFDSFVIVKD